MSRLLVILACLILAVASLFPASKNTTTRPAVKAAPAAAKELPDSLVCGYSPSSLPNSLR